MCNPPGSAPSHRAGLEPGMPVREALGSTKEAKGNSLFLRSGEWGLHTALTSITHACTVCSFNSLFLVISWLNWRQTRMQFLVHLFMMTRSEHVPWAQWRQTGQERLFYWQPNSVSLFYRSSFGWCTFSALICLAPGAEAKLQCTSEKSRWMWMQKNTLVPRLNKGISCQEKGDKNCSFEQGGQA